MAKTTASDKPRKKRSTILEFAGVTLIATDQRHRTFRDVNLKLRESQLALVLEPPRRTQQLIGPAALGLITPNDGTVSFRRRDWQAMPYEAQLRQRHRIGRVFSIGGWVDNLTVIDNITLAERHHSTDAEEEILNKANACAQRFKMESIPEARPAQVSPVVLRRCQWVRAMFPERELLVLEEPLDGIDDKDYQSLLDAEYDHRKQGGATLWITDQPRVWSRDHQGEVQRFRVSDDKLEEAKGPVS